jgi:hypothetical protein
MKKYFLLIFLILIAIFLIHEFWQTKNRGFQIFAEKDYLLIRSETGNIWSYGNLESPSVENLKQNITPYFSHEKIRDIYRLEEGKEYHDEKLIWQKISRNIVHAKFENKTLLFFAENYDDTDREKLIKSSVALKADWIILNKNLVLDFLPNPKQGILYVADRVPSKKRQTNSREKNIPLISTQKTGGFRLKLHKNKWQLFTRNS